MGIVSVFDIDMSENGIDGLAIYLFDDGSAESPQNRPFQVRECTPGQRSKAGASYGNEFNVLRVIFRDGFVLIGKHFDV